MSSLYPGETVRLAAEDVTHTVDGAVTTGAVVEFTITEEDGTVMVGPVSATADTDDWSVFVNLPDDPGPYYLKGVITVDGTIVGKERSRFIIDPF